MDIATIRAKMRSKQYFIYDHALVEAFKDGLSIINIRYILLSGEIIEDYPERQGCLIGGNLQNGMPVHVIVEYVHFDLAIVTTYVPDQRAWIKFRIRRLRSQR